LLDVAKSLQSLNGTERANIGFDSLKVNSNGSVTGSYTETGSRIKRSVTCNADGKCKNN